MLEVITKTKDVPGLQGLLQRTFPGGATGEKEVRELQPIKPDVPIDFEELGFEDTDYQPVEFDDEQELFRDYDRDVPISPYAPTPLPGEWPEQIPQREQEKKEQRVQSLSDLYRKQYIDPEEFKRKGEAKRRATLRGLY